MPRTLVPGQVLVAPIAHLLLGQLRILAHDEQLDRFAGMRIRHTDRSTLQHAWKAGDHPLDLGLSSYLAARMARTKRAR